MLIFFFGEAGNSGGEQKQQNSERPNHGRTIA
jgi:hypothetical protein